MTHSRAKTAGITALEEVTTMGNFSGRVALVAFMSMLFVGSVPVAFGESTGLLTPAFAKADKSSRVSDWFQRYDQIRHEAQMSEAERERSRALMTNSIAASFLQSPSGAQDKAAASALLRKMVDRYHRALAQITDLPAISETKKLQQGYTLYFRNAGDLFGDYLKVQNSLLATDASGNPILGQLQQRKADLENLDFANKDLDAKLRTKFKVAPYAF
jgi:hypothetical protein